MAKKSKSTIQQLKLIHELVENLETEAAVEDTAAEAEETVPGVTEEATAAVSDPVPHTLSPVFKAPNVMVRDGLILELDASDYEGGAWKNLLDVNYAAELFNDGGSIYKNSGFGGVIECSGASPNDGFVLTDSNFEKGPYTFICATRYTNDSKNGRIVSAAANNWLLGNWGNSTGHYFGDDFVSDPNKNTFDTDWHIYAGTQNTSTNEYRLYDNGIDVTFRANGATHGPIGLSIFKNLYNETSQGQIKFLLVYPYILSPEQILSVYNFKAPSLGLSQRSN